MLQYYVIEMTVVQAQQLGAYLVMLDIVFILECAVLGQYILYQSHSNTCLLNHVYPSL